MWPISYFQRKSEERKQALKKEILSEILTELEEKKKELVCAGQKEITELFDRRKKGLETKVNTLSDKVDRYQSKSKNAIESADAIKKDSKRLKAAAEETKQEAASIADRIKEMTEIVVRAEEAAANINVRLEEYMAKAVEQATATVKSEMQTAVQAAREEHAFNKEELGDLVRETRTHLSNTLHTALSSQLAEAKKQLEELRTLYSGKLESITGQAQSVLDQVQDDALYLKNTFDYIQQNFTLVIYATTLIDSQKQLLRELFSDKYKGDLNQLRSDIRQKSRDTQSRNITLSEIDLKYAEGGIKEMIGFVKRHQCNLRALLEAVDRIENVYNAASRSSRRGQ
ncbi:hypothetical protein KY310_04300 [Candidatus Woesearchaeota archaeon]|nr:hypothetical protein [Candidatus Woesearchaeota archaeon]